jgi:hypothetical protein
MRRVEALPEPQREEGIMSRTSLGRLGAVAMVGISAIHLLLAPEYLGEAPYIGVVFILRAAAAAGVAVTLWRSPNQPASALGGLIAAGMAVGFVLSRTVELPGFHEADWKLSGAVSLLLELGFVGAAGAVAPSVIKRRRRVKPPWRRPTRSSRVAGAYDEPAQHIQVVR